MSRRSQPRRAGAGRVTLAADGRAAAVQVLRAVLEHGARLDEALADAYPALAERRERSLCRALASGTLRWYLRLDPALQQLLTRPLGDPGLRAVLLLGLYQIDATRIPPHAAVSTSVELARRIGLGRASGLVNGVLRRFVREREAIMHGVDRDRAARNAHPAWLLAQLDAAWPDDVQAILDAGNTPAPLAVRVNLIRQSRADYLQRLLAADIQAHATPWAAAGVMLEDLADPTTLPGFHAGDVAVQDAASQLVTEVLVAAPGERVLDACAAPGGKSAALLEAHAGIELTSLELDPGRAARLRDNLARQGHQAHLLGGDAARPETWWDSRPFDHVLLDAPCSATGIIRRHPDIKLRRRAGDGGRFASTQLGLLRALWPTLARGGTLVYATCSILPAENAEVVRAFLAGQADAREHPVDAGWGRPAWPGRQILPGEAGMDGFYYARIRKS